MSSTREHLPEALFKEVFEDILRKCIAGGLVSGHTQIIDSAPIKTSASRDSLELKVPAEELEEHLARIRYQKHTRQRKATRRTQSQRKQGHPRTTKH